MLFAFSQYYLKVFNPAWQAFLTRLVYGGGRVRIGKGLHTDSVPRIIVDKGCRLVIGDDVEFRRNVEIRVHGASVVTIGSKVRIDRGVRVLAANSAHIDIQNGVRIGLYTVLNGGDSITIGKKALVSGFVYLQTSMHGYAARDKAVQDQGYDHAPVYLGDDAWLGTHVVVLPGVTIGQGGVVGSNAVVTKNVDAYQVVAGIPAKSIKERQ